MDAARRMKLTKRSVDGLRPRTERYVAWDADLKGFGVAVQPSGRKSYLLKYRTGGGRRGTIRKPKIGDHGELTCEQARRIAERWKAEVRAGGDPSAERRETPGTPAPDVAELARRYLEEHAVPHKKTSSARHDRDLLRLHVLPALGRRRVAELTVGDMQRLHGALRDRPYAANRTLALLSTMLGLAEHWGLRPSGSNPCRHVRRYREHARERFLSIEEVERLGAALTRLVEELRVPPAAAGAIRMLLLTGCRLSEVLTLRWEHVNSAARRLELPDSKTGRKAVPLGRAAVDLLAALPWAEGNPYVFPGRQPGKRLVGLQKIWERVRAQAGLEGVRLHDLRHSFASAAVASGLGLPVVGAVLGHRHHATTARYAHVADDPALAAADATAARIAHALAIGSHGVSKA